MDANELIRIQLTDEQRQALEREPGKPLDVMDPATQECYVLLAREQYARMCSLLDRSSSASSADTSFEIPIGILRSQQAFWRDLPELLKEKRNGGKWVCYHGDERLGIGDRELLIRETLQRAIPEDAYYMDCIQPQELAPWEDIEVEPPHPPIHEEPVPTP
jgi:hypothetical protein